MSRNVTIVEAKTRKVRTMRDLKVGEYAVIDEPGTSDHGLVVARVYDLQEGIKIVCVHSPTDTWSGEPIVAVRLLPVGTRIEFTIEEASNA